jgi:hypothetical protein
MLTCDVKSKLRSQSGFTMSKLRFQSGFILELDFPAATIDALV